MAEDSEDRGDLVEEEPKAIVLEENNAVDVDETEVTVWAPEPKGSDEMLKFSVEEWIKDVDFESTADVPIPKRLVDQVIGQEPGSLIIKKAED